MGQRLVFLPRLEALRGLAAISVVAYHAFAHFIDTSVTGMAPVVLFFVLSGFVLARSLAKDGDLVAFLRRRVFRLFPAGAAVVLVLTVLHEAYGFYVGFKPDFSAVNVLLNVAMMRHDINGPMWSIMVECVATPLILLSFWLCSRHAWRSILSIVLLLFGLSFLGQYAHLLGGFSNLAPLYAFVVGVGLHFAGGPLVARAGRWRVPVAVAAAVVLVLCGLQKQTAPIFLIETASAGMLIALVAFERGMWCFNFLDHPVIAFYGRISYSFYLFHTIGLTLALRMVGVANWPITSAVVATAIGVILTTPMAWASWRFIECPFVAIGRRFGEPASADPGAVIGDRPRAGTPVPPR